MFKKAHLAVVVGLLAVIPFGFNACSGGSSGGSAPTSAAVQFQGRAAEGAPLSNASVEIRGANGSTTSTTTDSEGNFTANVAGLSYPLMFKANGANVYFSLAHSGTYVNITPFTTLVLTKLLGVNPLSVFTAFDATTLQTPSDLAAASSAIIQKFPSLTQLSSLDFFNDRFTPSQGDRHDDLLEDFKAELVISGQAFNSVVNEIIAESTPPSGSCATGEHRESGVCLSNIRACAVANGSGEQVYSQTGWSACSLVICNSNFTLAGQLCAANSRACVTLPANATSGTETWNGSSWATCQISACSSSYSLNLNMCVATTAPGSEVLTVHETGLSNAKRPLAVSTLGTKTLVEAREDASEDGYLFGAASPALVFGRASGAVSNTLYGADAVGADAYYQMHNPASAGAITFYKMNLASGGTSIPVTIPSGSTSGWHESGRVALHAHGNAIYYRARSAETPAYAPGSLFKYDTATTATTRVIENLSTNVVTYPQKLVSQNLLTFERSYVSGKVKLDFKAVDGNDQLISLLSSNSDQYTCVTSLTPFYDCAPMFLSGHAIYLVEARSEGKYKFVILDGTSAGTRIVDVPYLNGGLGNVTVFQGRLVFAAMMTFTEGTQLYTYSPTDGFQELAKISPPFGSPTSVTVTAIAATNSDLYIILKRTTSAYTNHSFNVVSTGQILTSKGTKATTTVLIDSVSAPTLAMLSLGASERGPLITLKGHLVYSTSNADKTNYKLKALNLTTEVETILKSSFSRDTILSYQKDPNFERIILMEPRPDDSQIKGRIVTID